MQTVKTYFKGGKGILNPTDFFGNEINEGDILTTDSWASDNSFFTTFYPDWTDIMIEKWKNRPSYVVKWNEKGFFYGVGVSQDLYLHDFRFSKCKKID